MNDILLRYVEDLEKAYAEMSVKYKTLQEALRIAGQYSRDNLPGFIPDNADYLRIYTGGADRDPEGKEFIAYWLTQAKEQRPH